MLGEVSVHRDAVGDRAHDDGVSNLLQDLGVGMEGDDPQDCEFVPEL